MLRWYVTTVLGAGTDANPYRTALRTVLGLSTRVNYQVEADSRVNDALPAGWMLVQADVTPAQHALLVADARVRYLPFEDAGGTLLGLDDPISLIPAATRDAMRTALENNHIPTHDFAADTPIRAVLRRIAIRARLRQILRADDFAELLDTLISDISAARRATIGAKLQAAGFDTSVIQLSDTIREALRKLAGQARI